MNHNYNEYVDHLVSTMPQSTGPKMTQTKDDYSAPFDSEAYANYKALVNKEKEKIDPNNLTESIYKFVFVVDTSYQSSPRQRKLQVLLSLRPFYQYHKLDFP